MFWSGNSLVVESMVKKFSYTVVRILPKGISKYRRCCLESEPPTETAQIGESDMCEFCDGREKRIENGFTYGNAHIEKNFYYSYSLRYDNSGDEYGEGAFEINYCPICGRKLVEE